MPIQGLRELDLALAELGRKPAGKVGRRAVRDGAEIIARQARDNAPEKSGRLKRAIRVRAGKGRKGSVSAVVTINKRFFQGDEFYGAFQEFGYRRGSRKLGNRRKKIEGKHFIERAFDQKAQAAVETIIESLKQGIYDVRQKE